MKDTMKSLRFGIEIETLDQERDVVARAIQTVVGGTVRHAGGHHDVWEVLDSTGRVWKVMTDASLRAPLSLQAEIVSPILTWDDLPRLQDVVRAVRTAGATTDPSCGIHVHVGAECFDATKLTNLAKLVYQQEDLIVTALGVQSTRLARYTKKLDAEFIGRLERACPQDRDALNRVWYGYHNRAPYHYDETRYRGLNLHSVWFRGTFEFRWFEATLHAGKVKAYIQFCLALAAKALTSKKALSRKRALTPETAKYDFRVFLLRLGLIGEEFKTARLHLLAHMGGSAAWKHTRPANTNATASAPASA